MVPTDGGAVTRYGISETEWRQRLNAARSLQRILGRNRLVRAEGKHEAQKEGATGPLKKVRAVAEIEAVAAPPTRQPEAQAPFDMLAK